MTTTDPVAMASVAGDPLVWGAILLAGVVSHALRMLPFMVLRPPENAAASPLFRFFDYAAFAVLGGIIGSALLTPLPGRALMGYAHGATLVSVVVVVACFLIARRLDRPLLIVPLGLATHALLTMLLVT